MGIRLAREEAERVSGGNSVQGLADHSQTVGIYSRDTEELFGFRFPKITLVAVWRINHKGVLQ